MERSIPIAAQRVKTGKFEAISNIPPALLAVLGLWQGLPTLATEAGDKVALPEIDPSLMGLMGLGHAAYLRN